MWEVHQTWESISSVPLGESTAYLLEFADTPMLLVQCSEDSSIDSELKSSAQQLGTGNQSLDSEQQLNQ